MFYKYYLLQESIQKLCAEAQKVDEELENEEAALELEKKELFEAKKQCDQLQNELDKTEYKTHNVRHNLSKSQQETGVVRLRIKVADTLLVEQRQNECWTKEHTAQAEAVAKVAQRRMNAWVLISQGQHGTSPEEKAVKQLCKNVEETKKLRDSLLHSRDKLGPLRAKVKMLEQQNKNLEVEVSLSFHCSIIHTNSKGNFPVMTC